MGEGAKASVAMSGHTATPWKVSDTVLENGHVKVNGEGLGGLIAVVGNGEVAPDRFTANAAFIVTAVNSHADLVKALERLLAAFKGLQPFPLVVQAVAVGLVRDAEAALALATTARPERAV